ncbi:hypothetical protein [Lentibacillus sp. Marseille-P4043]|uniref:hypothetical protein n=1 Tax=Lentibacillus sp. Marseille-P4043 TaxID=2040293 RepID=UPI000D0B3A91|nr:hypothetical protein [Lentibacillus sp. Marseille-P4043]
MITINIEKIKVNTAKNQSGVFIGNNYAPNWSYFSKGNTNVSGNHVSDNVNVILDEDEKDFSVMNNNNAKKIADEAEDLVINRNKKQSKHKSMKGHNKKAKKAINKNFKHKQKN